MSAHSEVQATERPGAFDIGLPDILFTALAVAVIAALGAYADPAWVPAGIAGLFGFAAVHAYDKTTRISVGAIAALCALFVVKMWPTAVSLTGGEPVVESPTQLSWLIGLPLGGAIFMLFMPRQAHGLLKNLTLGIMVLTFAASLPLLGVAMGSGYHFDQNLAWIPQFGIRYHVALDGVSYWLVLLTTFSVPLATFVSFGSIHTRLKDWVFSLLLLEAGMIGAFVALDLFLFYVFWELMLIPMYVMIGVWGGSDRVKAAVKFFLYTMFGSVLMLAAILYLAYAYGKVAGAPSFDYFDLQRLVLPRSTQVWLWAAFALSFLIKVPMWPVHTWLPDAHTEAPTAGSMLLAAVMLKLGTYGYLRFCLGLFPEASIEWGINLAAVAVCGGILYAALCAWQQTDLKRLVAYSSVAHLGYVMLGIFSMTQAGVEGAVLQMVNHGMSTGALFLLVGVLYDRRHTRQLADFGGIASQMPIYTVMFIIATMASVGLPGTNGFIGEFMVITGTAASLRLGHFAGIQAVGAALGVVLGALYMLTAVQKVFFGPVTKKENEGLPDMNSREIIGIAPLVAFIFILGLAPNLFLQSISGATTRIIRDVNERLDASPPPEFHRGVPKLLNRRPEAPAAPVVAETK
jgi:NADH-quinone oxidoreductase subunit M